MECGAQQTAGAESARCATANTSAGVAEKNRRPRIRRLSKQASPSDAVSSGVTTASRRNGGAIRQNGAAKPKLSGTTAKAKSNNTDSPAKPNGRPARGGQDVVAAQSRDNAGPPRSTDTLPAAEGKAAGPAKKPDPRSNMFGSKGRGLYSGAGNSSCGDRTDSPDVSGDESAPVADASDLTRMLNGSASADNAERAMEAETRDSDVATSADLDWMLSGPEITNDTSVAAESEMLDAMLAPPPKPQAPVRQVHQQLPMSGNTVSAGPREADNNSDVIPTRGTAVPHTAEPPRQPLPPANIASQDPNRTPISAASHQTVSGQAAPPAPLPVTQVYPSPAVATQPMLQSAMTPTMPVATQIDEPQQPQTRPAPPAIKLPPPPQRIDPEEDDGHSAANDEADDGVEQKIASQVGSGDVEDGADKESVQQKRAANVESFLESVQAAHASLLKKQKPIPQEVPRLLAKNIQKLELLSSDKTKDILKRLRIVARSHSPSAIETLREFSKRPHGEIRMACVEGMAGIDHARSSAALLEFLTDVSTEILTAAVRALLTLGQTEVIMPLAWMTVADARGLTAVRDAISSLDDDVVKDWVVPLQRIIKADDEPRIVAAAVRLLVAFRGKDLVRTHIALTSHASAEVRMAAMEAVIHAEQKQTVRCLNRGMKDPAPAVRSMAAAGLAKINSPKSISLLVAALQDQETSVRRSAAKTLTTLDGKEFAEGASRALNSENDPDVIEYLLEIVGKCGTDEALAKLQQFLDSDDIACRHRALNTLRRLKSPKGVRLLGSMLTDENDETRQLAVEAVGYPAARSVAATLRQLLSDDTSKQIRAAAARSLGQIKDEESISALEEALHDEYIVKLQAVIALGLIGNKTVIPALLVQLRDAASEVRYHACNSLRQIGNLPNAEPLRNLLEDSDSMVRRGAETALTDLGHPFRKARFASRLKKMSTQLLPNTVAGALPGGTLVMVGVVAIAVMYSGYFAISRMDFSAEPEFPISDVRAIAVSNDGTHLSIARKFRVFEVWDLNSRKQTAQFQAASGGDGLVFREDGDALVLAGSKSFNFDIQAAPTNGGAALSAASLTNVSGHKIARTPDQKKAILCAATGSATLVDLTSGRELLAFKIKDFNEKDSIAMSPDAALGFVGTVSGFLKVISLQDGKPMGRINVGELVGLPGARVTALAVDQSGTFIAIGTSSGNVIVVDTNEMKEIGKPYAGSDAIIGVNFAKDSNQLSVVTRRGELATCSDDYQSSTILSTSPSGLPERVAFSGDGSVVAFAFAESERFSVIDLLHDTVLVSHPLRQ